MVRVFASIWWIAAAACCYAQSGAYFIGNSLTNNCRLAELPGRNDYHMQSGATLATMYANPGAELVAGSTRWDTALAAHQYSYVVLQPFAGETLDQIATAAAAWLALQPNATIVIHTNWAGSAPWSASDDVPTEWADPSTTSVKRSNTFYAALLTRLQSDHPGRTFLQTQTHAMVYDVYADCLADAAPFEEYSYLYADQLHLSSTLNGGAGQYLAHNALRRTLGLPYQTPPGFTVTADVREYLRAKIDAYHGPHKTTGVFQ